MNEFHLPVAAPDDSHPPRDEAPTLAIVRGVSHDVRSALGVISGLHSLLPLATTDAERNEMYERLHKNTEFVTELFADLEDYCMMESAPAPESLLFSPQAIFLDMRRRLLPMLKRRKVTLQVTGDPASQVTGDEEKVQRIARNLVFYLIHVIQARELDVHWESSRDTWRLQVTYSGAPLPDAVFLPETAGNVRVESGKTIGLLLVRRLVLLMQATISGSTLAGDQRQLISIDFRQ